jgi:hypothetical protein
MPIDEVATYYSGRNRAAVAISNAANEAGIRSRSAITPVDRHGHSVIENRIGMPALSVAAHSGLGSHRRRCGQKLKASVESAHGDPGTTVSISIV